MVTVLEGKGKFTIGGEEFILEEGKTIIMPKDIPHAVYGEERFKMLLVVSFQFYINIKNDLKQSKVFKESVSLVDGAGEYLTKFDSDNISKDYAIISTKDVKGYFTDINDKTDNKNNLY